MKKIGFSLLLLIFFSISSAQVPQGFNYQAIARNTDGSPLINATIKVKLSILSDTVGFYQSGDGTYLWEEEHLNVKTNGTGFFSLVLGDPSVLKVRGTAAAFNEIDWTKTPLFIGVKVANPSEYTNMGTSKLWSVPYAMVADSLGGPLSKLNVKAPAGSSPDDALFEVKNKTGQTVFAVYNEGVRIYVDDGKKGTKGGFAVSGFGTVSKAGEAQPLLIVNPDSIRAYVFDDPLEKAVKGGFAVSGFNNAKGVTNDYLRVSPDSVRVYIEKQDDQKGVKGGFAVSGFSLSKESVPQKLLTINEDSVRIYLDESSKEGKALKGGFAVSGFNMSKGYDVKYLNVTPDSTRIITTDEIRGFGVSNLNSGSSQGYLRLNPSNYFIGHEAGSNISTGLYNSFIGYQAGYSTDEGNNNVFIGNKVGFSNTSGYNNTFIGVDAGYANTSGYRNTFIGTQAGYQNTSGAANVAIGSYTLFGNTTGNGNVAIGSSVLSSNTSGTVNVAIGDITMMNNTTGTGNVAAGSGALYSNTEGTENIAIGINSLFSNTTGRFNVAAGRYVLNSNTTGEANVALGDRSLYLNSAGSSNVAIGRQAGYNSLGYHNVFIGDMAGYEETGSYKLYIATSLTEPTRPLIGGSFSPTPMVGINKMPETYTLEVNGTIWANGATISAGSTTWSDARFKMNITPIGNALSDVLQLQGVYFDWNVNDFPDYNFPDGQQLGVIAQDVEKNLPQLVYTGPDGYKSVAYEKLVPVLIEAIREQQQQIESDKTEIQILKSQVQLLIEKVNQLETVAEK
jgi:hypothetical protein